MPKEKKAKERILGLHDMIVERRAFPRRKPRPEDEAFLAWEEREVIRKWRERQQARQEGRPSGA